jgi:hypothetical protein
MVEPFEKLTVSKRLERSTGVTDGKLGSGKGVEFGPLWLLMSNAAVLPGAVTS